MDIEELNNVKYLHKYRKMKRCPSCNSPFIDDDKCDSCGKIFKSDELRVGSPFGEKSIYGKGEKLRGEELKKFLVMRLGHIVSYLNSKKRADENQFRIEIDDILIELVRLRVKQRIIEFVLHKTPGKWSEYSRETFQFLEIHHKGFFMKFWEMRFFNNTLSTKFLFFYLLKF